MKKPRVKNSREVLQHIDPSKKVRVYRNLHKGCISVKQDGIVRCHTDNVVLKDCKFIISKAGQRRVRLEKKKNVHAYVEGYVIDAHEADLAIGDSQWSEVYYNPYKCDGFMDKEQGKIAEFANFVDVDGDGFVGPQIIAHGIKHQHKPFEDIYSHLNDPLFRLVSMN